jgi:hypothetical protein
MFRHYLIILRELVINILSIYTNILNTAVGNTVEFYFHVTVHRNKFVYNKTNYMH